MPITIPRIFRVEFELDANSNLMTDIHLHYYEYLPDNENQGQVFKDENGKAIPLGGHKTIMLDPTDSESFPSLLKAQQEIGIKFAEMIEEGNSS